METIIGRVLALVITALAMVGVYQVYANARENQNLNDLQTQMAQIQQAVTATYQRSSTKYNFASAPIADATAAAMGLVPPNIVTTSTSGSTTTTTVSNPFGGTYQITTGGATATSFGVYATKIPGNACIQVLQNLSTNSTALGFTTDKTAATTAPTATAPTTAFSPSPAAGAIETACTPTSPLTTVALTVFYNG